MEAQGKMNQKPQAGGMATMRHVRASAGVRTPAPGLLLFFALAVIFVVFNTLFEPAAMPAIPLVGGARMFIQDLLLWLLLIFGLFSRLSHSRTAINSPLSKYIIFFVFIVVAEAIYSVVALDRTLFSVYNDSKGFFYYLLFFPVIWCFGTEKGVDWIIKLWTVLALFGALLYVYQFFFGELAIFQRYDWLYSSSLEVSTGGADAVAVEYKRLIMQGTVLFRIMLFVAFCMWLFPTGRKRHWWGLLALLLALQVLLQFTRGMYVTTALALILMPFMLREYKARSRIRNILVFGALAVGLTVFYTAVISGGGKAQYSLVQFIIERLVRAVTESGQDTSLQGRALGASYIFSMISQYGNWLTGLGFGSTISYGDSTYVSLLLKTGWIGTLAFIAMFGYACVRGMRRFRYIVSPVHKALMLALLVSTVRHLINGITQSDFALDARIPALIVSVAIMEIIIARGIRPQTKVAPSP